MNNHKSTFGAVASASLVDSAVLKVNGESLGDLLEDF